MQTRERIQQVIDFVEENLLAEFTFSELAEMAGYSYSHFSKLFRTHVGMSLKRYCSRRKLLHAVYAMANGCTKMDAALAYGFSSYAGFYKAFRKEFSCSPSAFIQTYAGAKPHKVNILQEEHIMLSKTHIEKLLPLWGLENQPVLPVINANTGRINENTFFIGENAVIKASANLGTVRQTAELSEKLSAAGIPAARVIPLQNGEIFLRDGELFYLAMTRLPGSGLSCGEVLEKPGLAVLIGEHIARLHTSLQQIPPEAYGQGNLYEESRRALEIVKRLTAVDDGFAAGFPVQFAGLYPLLHRQLIHRDVTPSNLCIQDGCFAGFVDFELSQVNVRIFDICYCATAILSECFDRMEVCRENWELLFTNLIKGYESVSPLSHEEKQALPLVVCAIQMICIAYFSRFDKYEELTKTNIRIFQWLLRQKPEM